MNKQTTHLISATNDSAKARKAPEWGIKLVQQTWLLDIGRRGRLVPEDDHLFPLAPPRALPQGRRLDGNASAANLSVMMELGDPTYESAEVYGRLSTPHHPERSARVSPSRMLKLTPTHVDAKGGHRREDDGSFSNAKSLLDPSNVLSPPKQETERVLNNADVTRQSGPSQAKVGKTLSAPPNAESLKKEAVSNPLRSSSTGGHAAASLKKDDMTSMLRQLVEKTDTSGNKSKPVSENNASGDGN